jgi:hypothetical protein
LTKLSVSFAQNIFADKQLHPAEAQHWHKLSFVAGFKLPRSLLIAQVQALGDFDCLLRAMEAEAK